MSLQLIVVSWYEKVKRKKYNQHEERSCLAYLCTLGYISFVCVCVFCYQNQLPYIYIWNYICMYIYIISLCEYKFCLSSLLILSCLILHMDFVLFICHGPCPYFFVFSHLTVACLCSSLPSSLHLSDFSISSHSS